jgi:heat shock protein HtpX
MESPQSQPLTFSIHTEVAPIYLSELLIFIYREYIVRYYQNFQNIRRWKTNGDEVLAFTYVESHGSWQVEIEVRTGNPLEVKMIPIGIIPQASLNRLREDLIITIQVFEEKIRKNTLYFAWIPKKGAIPERSPNTRRKIIKQIFMGNMLLFFVIFILLSYVAFLVVTELFGLPILYFPILLVVAQFIMILFSHKIVGSMGDWVVNEKNPYVYILQYHIPEEHSEIFRQRYNRDTLLKIKQEIYERTLAFGDPLNKQIVIEVFSKYGVNTVPENLVAKKINIFQIVKEAADQFKIKIPRIMLSNVIIPNAAATGLSPTFGLILITTGLLVQLNDEEILSVIGHEMSHINRRDPLALFVLVSAEYLSRVYLLWNAISYFGMFYFFFALGIVYFIAKFFEARADLDSAAKLGKPQILAQALRKIGYRKIQIERMQSNRIWSWLGWNPHPPISFRVERLENMREPQKIKHSLIVSIKDCIKGLIDEF